MWGCVWVVVAWYLLARTKTLTWTGYLRFFTACLPWSVAIGLVSTWLAETVVGTYVRATGPGMGIAAITEETLKLVPVALVALLAPRRASRFAATDWLLLGLASGTAFLLTEEALRRLTLTGRPGLLDLIDRLLSDSDLPRGWIAFRAWPVPTDWDDAGRGFGGHGVVTAIITALVGLALVAVRHVRGRQDRAALLVRVDAVAVPFVALVVAIADHAVYNGGGGGYAPDDGAPYWLDPATTRVPWWIRWSWSLFGHGLFRPTVFVVLAAVLLLVDGARLARLPAAALDPRPRPRWIDRATDAVRSRTAAWPAPVRALPARSVFAVLGRGGSWRVTRARRWPGSPVAPGSRVSRRRGRGPRSWPGSAPSASWGTPSWRVRSTCARAGGSPRERWFCSWPERSSSHPSSPRASSGPTTVRVGSPGSWTSSVAGGTASPRPRRWPSGSGPVPCSP